MRTMRTKIFLWLLISCLYGIYGSWWIRSWQTKLYFLMDYPKWASVIFMTKKININNYPN
jgi:hypothetical protein